MSRPSIVPIALTLDDRTGYTLWAPPWEEDGEEWQAFLGSTVDLPADADDDPEAAVPTAVVHLFPSPAALAAFCRASTDHDLSDHPVWPVVAGLDAADLTPDEDHRFDLDGVYDVVAENPDRWAVDELAATLDIVGRLAECCDAGAADDEDEDDDEDDETSFEAVAELVSRSEAAALRLGIDAFLGRDGEESWVRLGTAIDELWEDVLEELDEHLDWTGAGTVAVESYPSAAEEAEARAAEPDDADDDIELVDDDDPVPSSSQVSATAPAASAGSGIRTIRGGTGVTATPAAVAAAQEFWEAVGILPVEVVVPDGAGLTLRCYVEDRARFLGRDGQVFVFSTPAELARFCAGDEAHDLTEIASWPEVADTDTPTLPADQDRYDLVEISEVLAEVAAGAGGLVELRALLQPVEGALDLAEYAGLSRVQQHLAPGAPLGRVAARAETDPRAPLAAEEAPALAAAWDEVVADVGGALVFRTD